MTTRDRERKAEVIAAVGRRAYEAAKLRLTCHQRGRRMPLRAIAARLGVSHETVRADLRKVAAFAQTAESYQNPNNSAKMS